MDTEGRKIYIYDVFGDQNFYTSDVELKFFLQNPIFNIWYKDTVSMSEEERDQYVIDNIFHIKTFTVDLDRDFPNLETSSFSAEAISEMITRVKSDFSRYLYPIDESPIDRDMFQPQVKCEYPCFQCHQSQPAYCLECWGPEIPVELNGSKENLKIFI